MKQETKYKTFKISVNIPFFHYYSNSKIYEIRSWKNMIVPIFLYSTATLLLGFWGLRVFKSLEALHINFSGGEDYSNQVFEYEYNETTNFIWSNLSRETSKKLNRADIEMILNFQEKYMGLNKDVFSDNNVYYLKNAMSRKGYKNLRDTDIVDFFEALQLLIKKDK